MPGRKFYWKALSNDLNVIELQAYILLVFSWETILRAAHINLWFGHTNK